MSGTFTLERDLPSSDGAETMGSRMGGGALLSLVADRFAEEDRQRSAELEETLRTAWHCRYCHSMLSDYRAVKTPGVCSGKPCKWRALREGKGERATEPEIARARARLAAHGIEVQGREPRRRGPYARR